MSTIWIKNATLVTLDADGSILHNADIYIDNGRITHLGSVPQGITADEIIDASHHAVLPGFFNAHCHAAMTFERGWAEDLPFPRWLNEKIWVAESALTPEDVYWGAALAACEMIRSGTVAFNDHYFYMNRVAEVVEQSGMKALLAWCVFGIGDDKEIGPGAEQQIAFSAQWNHAAGGRIHTALGPHSPYVCPPDFLERIVAAASEHGLPIHLHIADAEEQVTNSLERYGKTPVEHLASLGVFDHHTIAAHSLTMSDNDITIFQTHDVHIARTPITYMKLAMTIPTSISALHRAGLTRIALGSDGPASNATMDMWEILRQAVWLEKFTQQNPEALPGDTPLRMATQNGAAAMGFSESGILAVNRPADLILVNLDRPHMRPCHNLVANLVHTGKGADVTHVIVNGKLLMRDRELLTLDEERILYEAEQHAFRMVNQDMRQMRQYDA